MALRPPVGNEPSSASALPSASPTAPFSTTHLIFLSRSYFPLLDGLRCLSIIAVVWFHAAGGAYKSGILSHGEEGVSLFFVISGFLITTLLLREQSTAGVISLKRFYLRRTFRIFPLYYAILTLYAILVIVLEKESAAGHLFWHNFPYFSTYTSNWFVSLDSDRVIFFFAWSLATEEQFYFFWPWIVKASAKPSLPVVTMLVLLALHYGAGVVAVNGAPAPVLFLTRVLISISPPICLGALAAFLVHRPTTFCWIEPWLGSRLSATAALATTIAVLASGELPGLVLDAAMTWLVVACALRPDDQPLRLVFTNPLVKHVGVVSYGIYLMHMLCINLVRRLVHTQDGPLIFVMALALSIAAATLSYRFFESPFLRWKDRLAKRPRELPGGGLAGIRAAP